MKKLSFALALVLVALPALAQDAEPAPAGDRATSFVAVDGAVTEDVPGGALLVGAYGAALVLMLGYVLWLGSLQAGANREIARLKKIVEKNDDPSVAKLEKTAP